MFVPRMSSSFARYGLAASLCLLLAACQGAEALPPPSAADARKLLTETLEAWKRGDAYEEFGKRTPPVRLHEPLWQAGARLHEYEIDSEGTAFGNSFNLRTRLVVQPAGKGKETRRVIYIVTSGDPLSIVRE